MNEIVDFFGTPLNVTKGEMHRQIDEFGNMSAYYIAIGDCLGHTVLLCYTNIDNYNINYVDKIISGLPNFASNYLLDTMYNNSNLLIYITRYLDSDSCYDIYYDFKSEDKSIDNLVNWMQLNNDFAMTNYKYTEIKNGKQTIPGQ